MVLRPKQIVQEHADRIESQLLGPTQFPVDGRRIKGFRLPHFEWLIAVLGVKLHPAIHGFV